MSLVLEEVFGEFGLGLSVNRIVCGCLMSVSIAADFSGWDIALYLPFGRASHDSLLTQSLRWQYHTTATMSSDSALTLSGMVGSMVDLDFSGEVTSCVS